MAKIVEFVDLKNFINFFSKHNNWVKSGIYHIVKEETSFCYTPEFPFQLEGSRSLILWFFGNEQPEKGIWLAKVNLN